MAGVQFSQRKFINGRKQSLFAVQYIPTSSKPVARLFFHHGMGEHAGRYAPMFKMIAEKGCAVFSYDAHGHGLSEPTAQHDRAVIWSFDDLVSDLYEYVEVIRDLHPGLVNLPTFIGGHSLGGLVSAHAVLKNQGMWTGMVLHSPAIDVEWTMALRMQAPVSGWLGWLLPRLRMVPAVRPEDMSSDPKVVETYLADPLIFHDLLPVRTGSQVLQAFQALQPRYAEFTLPIYAAHGTNDRCTSRDATKRLVAATSSRDKTFRDVQDGYHELLTGPEMQQCTERIIEWILAHASPRSVL